MKSPLPLLVALLAGVLVLALAPREAGAAVRYRYFKNTSNSPANDFHAHRGGNLGKFKTVAVELVGDPNSASDPNTPWPNKTFPGGGVESFEFTAGENNKEIPAGAFIRICSEPSAPTTAAEPLPDPNDVATSKLSFFTDDGVPISTTGYSTVTRAKEAGAQIRLSFRNTEHSFPVRVSSVVVLVDNTGDPDDLGFVPDGTLALGVPSQFDVGVNQEVGFFVSGFTDPDAPIYVSSLVAPVSDPNDTIPQEDVLLTADSVPDVGLVGVLAMALAIVTTGVVLIRRMRTRSA